MIPLFFLQIFVSICKEEIKSDQIAQSFYCQLCVHLKTDFTSSFSGSDSFPWWPKFALKYQQNLEKHDVVCFNFSQNTKFHVGQSNTKDLFVALYFTNQNNLDQISIGINE